MSHSPNGASLDHFMLEVTLRTFPIKVFQAGASIKQYNAFIGFYPALLDKRDQRSQCSCALGCGENAFHSSQAGLRFQYFLIAHGNRRAVARAYIVQNDAIGETLWHTQARSDSFCAKSKIAELCP